mmetsp:Transcript_61155/g.157711  ORF Transcript_61155/g.157711 Transcript_61155/m.157711 type:complete len:665 (+) Transcript_61155:62-2056(+)
MARWPGWVAAVAAGVAQLVPPADGSEFEVAPGCPPAGSNLVPLDALPLRTRGRFVVDAHGRQVQLACVNWYGAQQEQMVMNGLDMQTIASIADTIVGMSFNCVRLPFSLEQVLTNVSVPAPAASLRANPELQGLSPMKVYDATVAGLTKKGLMVILNQHISAAGWCCSNTDGEGLWYTDRYPEEDWLHGLEVAARRYRHDPLVVGFDLRNEVRPYESLIPTWGTGDKATDWAMAAVKGAKRVLAVSPDLLIVVSGIQFGMRLIEIPQRPIHATEPELRDRTIYTSHYYYGWSFTLMAYDMVGDRIVVLIVTACWLWVLLATDGWRGQHRHPGLLDARSRSTSHDSESAAACAAVGYAAFGDDSTTGSGGFSLCEWLHGRWEFALLTLFAVVFLVSFAIGTHLGDTCGHIAIVSPPAFVVISGICMQLSFVVWVRILAAYTLVLTVWHRHDDIAPLGFGREVSLEDAENLRVGSNEVLTEVQLAMCPDHKHSANSSCKSRGAEVADLLPHRLAAAVVSVFGPQGSRRLVEPLRRHKWLAAVGALATLSLMSHVGVRAGSYEAFARGLDACWGSVLTGDGMESAPVWLSEFGTDLNSLYWIHLVRYMRERRLDFAYWSINGEKRYHQSETYGLLKADSVTVRHPWKLEMLQQLIVPYNQSSSEPLR